MKWLFIIIFTFFIFSILTYKHYGITWDESTEIKRGYYLIGYLSGKVPDSIYFNVLKAGRTQYYHHLYPALLGIGSLSLSLLSQKTQSLLNYKLEEFYKQKFDLYDLLLNFENIHLLNLLFNGFLLIIFSYILFYKLYKNPLYATLGVLFILLTPRILGHMPTNLKDIPFATFYFSTICMIIFTFNKNSMLKILILIPFFFLTQSSRFIGYSIYPIYILYSILYYIYNKPSESFKNFIIHRFMEIVIIFMCSSFLTLITWPYLGKNYFQSMLELIEFGSKSLKMPVLTGGKHIYAYQNILLYIFTWYFVITPIPIFLGLTLNLLFFKKWNLVNSFIWLIVIFITILFIIVRPNLYDEIRQILFYQVLLSCLSAFGFIEFLKNFKSKIIKYCIVFIFCLLGLKVIYDLKKLHPYEYVYFNEFVGGLRGAYGKFETDYWGACQKEAFNFIKNRDLKNKRIYTVFFDGIGNKGYYISKYNIQRFKNKDSIDYAITIKRILAIPPDSFLQDKNFSLIYEVKRDGVPLCFVFERKQ